MRQVTVKPKPPLVEPTVDRQVPQDIFKEN